MDYSRSTSRFSLVRILVTFVVNVVIVYPIVSITQSTLQLHPSSIKFYGSTSKVVSKSLSQSLSLAS